MENVTVWLNTAGPDGATRISGILKRLDVCGVHISSPTWGQGYKDMFFPMRMIDRIDYHGETMR